MNCPQEAGIRKDLLGTATGLLFGKTTGTRVGMPASELAPTFEGAMDKTQVAPACDLQDAGRTHVLRFLNSGMERMRKAMRAFAAGLATGETVREVETAGGGEGVIVLDARGRLALDRGVKTFQRCLSERLCLCVDGCVGMKGCKSLCGQMEGKRDLSIWSLSLSPPTPLIPPFTHASS